MKDVTSIIRCLWTATPALIEVLCGALRETRVSHLELRPQHSLPSISQYSLPEKFQMRDPCLYLSTGEYMKLGQN